MSILKGIMKKRQESKEDPKPTSLSMAYSLRKNKGTRMLPPEATEEDRPTSIAAGIMRKRAPSIDLAESAMEGPADLDELNEEAAMKPAYDVDQLSDQPDDSNLMGDDIDSDKHDMISKIRAKMASKR